MSTKSANVYARIEPEVKEQAETILTILGIPTSSAINIFYKQIILCKGLPFDVKIPQHTMPSDISKISDAELHEELSKGYQDLLEGKTKPAQMVFNSIKKDYNL